jgi:hypothetical protein
MRLKNSDYIAILKYYHIDAKDMKTKDAKRKAEDLLANKLCRCIKKVDNKVYDEDKSESRAIAICKSSVLFKKGLRDYGFKCKPKARFIPKRGTFKKLIKFELETRKRRKMRKRRRTRKRKITTR